MKPIHNLLLPVAAAFLGIGIGLLMLAVTGYPALYTLRAMIEGTFADAYGFSQVMRSTALLTFTGLSVAIAFKAGLFNIGAEGQLYMGALAAGLFGAYLKELPKETLDGRPEWIWLLAATVIALAAAALWGLIPGVLKAWRGAHEVITTIMMNFIALALINYLLRPGSTLAAAGKRQTPTAPRSIRFDRLGDYYEPFAGSTINTSVILAPICAVLLWAWLKFTRAGFALRAVGLNPEAARAAGTSSRGVIVLAMMLSGAFAGFAGLEFVFGHKGWFEEGFSAGLGFLGIAVALLARNHPLGILLTAFLFGILNYSKVSIPSLFSTYKENGLLLETAITPPKDVLEIMQGIIILAVILGDRLLHHLTQKRKRALPLPESKSLKPSGI